MMQVEPVTLTGRHVELRPLSPSDAPYLYSVAQDDEIWRFLPVHRPDSLSRVEAFIAAALSRPGVELPFAIVERESGRAIGSTRYLDIAPEHRHLEIGWTWLGRDFWRTPINTECKYLLLRHAFEELGCIRVQLKTDSRNERSQRAIERIGAVREGVLRKAVIVKDGYERTSVYYSVIDDEWPSVKARLEAMLDVAKV
jgi:RimJ/RimL family protein N-acetyltransferase